MDSPDTILDDVRGEPSRERGVAGLDSEDRRDRELVLAVLGGDERAFETLLRRHESRVLRVARLLGVPPGDREDVAQEVFVRVFRFLGGFKTGKPFAGWVYRITVNAVHDYRARVGRRRRDETHWDPAMEGTTADPRPGRTTEAALDLRRRLEAALDVLSERERAVFVLKELEGLETRDVARALGITGITVRRHLGRARRSLQRLLELSEATAIPREAKKMRER